MIATGSTNTPLDSEEWPRIQAIKLKDDSELVMREGSLVALVGPNNAGKSHFLAQLRAVLYGGPTADANPSTGLIDSVRLSWPDRDLRKFLEMVANRMFSKRGEVWETNLSYDIYEASGVIAVPDIKELADDGNVFGQFIEAFVRYDEPLSRIKESEKQPLNNLSAALVRLQRQKAAYQAVQKDFEYIFDEQVSFWPYGGNLSFFLGKPDVEIPKMNDALGSQAIQFFESAPTIDRQGLGMRNVVGLLLRLYTDSRGIVLIDEPEAFLHPPQADRLGQIIGRVCKQERKQVICATHDRSLISGLSKGANEEIAIRRLGIERGVEQPYFSKAIGVEVLKDVRNKSRIRFTPVLESIFSSATVLVENEKDALFFEEALSQFNSHSSSGIPKNLRDSILFIPTNGNSNFASTRDLLRGLHSPTVVVGDLDLISDPERLRTTVASTGRGDAEEAGQLADKIVSRFSELHAEKLEKVKKDSREGKLKKIVADQLNAEHPDTRVKELLAEILELLEESGVLLIPHGELEDFDREVTNSKDKNEWVRTAIDQGVHRSDAVQEFVSAIVSRASREILEERDRGSRSERHKDTFEGCLAD